ncbi:unnamed protein product, partial [Tetraodon nigroviridis]
SWEPMTWCVRGSTSELRPPLVLSSFGRLWFWLAILAVLTSVALHDGTPFF